MGIPEGIYGITCKEYSKGRSNAEVAQEMVNAGIKIIQYREKEKSMKEKFMECREIRRITRNAGVLFIVNDNVDLALAAEADGLHLGQEDLPVPEARKLLGDKIIGVSTHSPEQALNAVKEGADYIGVGPIFRTSTKKGVCDPVGLGYVDWVVENIDIPFVAIGGIKEHNIGSVVKRGAKTIALVSEIVGADDIPGKVKRLREIAENQPASVTSL